MSINGIKHLTVNDNNMDTYDHGKWFDVHVFPVSSYEYCIFRNDNNNNNDDDDADDDFI